MPHSIDKRARAALFRDRLTAALAESGQNRTELARKVGVDRSTISQLLAADTARLPNAQVVGACAGVLGVSADWLLGLSDRPERAADIAALSMSMTRAPRALVDEQIFAWHQEAEGYKIRHVPAGLPDMLKTNAMLHWEYAPSLGRTADQAIGASRDKLDWMRQATSDYEIALPLHELQSFARGEGYYSEVPQQMRKEQLDYIAQLHAQLYPSLRVFLFDARRIYSAPVTIFGPLLAVIYLGSNYLAFRDTERVRAMTRHFDQLVREADLSPREFGQTLAKYKAQIG
ncbi:helix-turn-helix domain-containing protein [Aestuariibius sp. HNIBRBA575]|uniref:helix-turn-helix domain-containing protein n=1 Tax=Aestuariibius sp. HNIBRBA575 TaxID=3233343 RepID=UPI0034A3D9C6